MRKTNGYIYHSYENYKVTGLYGSNFIPNHRRSSFQIRYYYGNRNTFLFPISENMLTNARTLQVDFEDHLELLDTAKKLYIHPCCDISRTDVSKKYKRCLNMYMADAVVIPRNNLCNKVENHSVVFINDNTSEIAFVGFYLGDEEADKLFKRVQNSTMGTPLSDFLNPNVKNDCKACCPGLYDAKLSFIGTLAHLTSKEKHIIDYLSFLLPKDRLVFQETLVKKLGDETNEPTFESMMSVYDMLNSGEESVRDLGLKSMAALDYANYPKSFTYILMNSNWNYIKARNTTAVKYMLKTLGIKNSNYRRYMRYADRYITEKDYALCEQLIRKIEKLNNNIDYVHYCYDLPFVWIDEHFNVHPNLPPCQ